MILAIIAAACAVIITMMIGFFVMIQRLHDIHLSLNSRLSELVLSVSNQKFAEGHARGISDEQDRRAAALNVPDTAHHIEITTPPAR